MVRPLKIFPNNDGIHVIFKLGMIGLTVFERPFCQTPTDCKTPVLGKFLHSSSSGIDRSGRILRAQRVFMHPVSCDSEYMAQTAIGISNYCDHRTFVLLADLP
jgi:hypothetical protein